MTFETQIRIQKVAIIVKVQGYKWVKKIMVPVERLCHKVNTYEFFLPIKPFLK
jgi:hypothetical protein